ncbi:MAG: 1-phosphofructokinase family hexose kinase [Actinobacteria bacterium]|nr:1-phosphofructokinase family hexose kinase [Actinomycetota bacterium]
MILTLTPNPSVDRTVTLTEPLERGAVHRVAAETSHPGGKGVNISRACVVAGIPTTAVLPAPADDPFLRELDTLGVPWRAVPAGPPRVNVTVTEPDGTTTKLNSAGSTVGPELLEGLEEQVVAALELAAGWVVLAGSLPPGAPQDWYAGLVARLRGRGAQVAVDPSDAPLAALAEALPGSAPHLLKPNGAELASLTGHDGEALEEDPSAAVRAASQLVDRGVGAVLATLGGRGAVLVTPEGAWHASAPPTTVVSTVGAGDSSLFGYLLGDLRGLDPASRLALAVAYGSAAAGLPGTTVPQPHEVRPDLVEVCALQHPGGVNP